MTTDQSLLLLIADLNAQVHALQAQVQQLQEQASASGRSRPE